ncbi:alpha-mannosidase [Holotrichia oblita]|uniref:Alpha-mannosidase n=1 Tax=Holotrichia oblita TaxID=644536 RepID=A0ACB9TSK0_HOLOL|nr:alpha-mannosidase [Holotrichia oblita]
MFTLKFCALLWCLAAIGLSHPTKREDKPKCGYESCHPVKEGYINVHIVPHTHDDVGWLKTVDQYYYGEYSDIQNAGVQYILDSVIDSLENDPNRRFIYVETAFLWKWWMAQHDSIKHKVQRLVRSGQLEIIGGAWSMNDEATTHYQSIVDQFTWGLRRLNDTFGECGRPKIGWQIDPFGHSREMASIFSQLGFDGILLGRIDYQDKAERFETKTPEFMWQSSDNLGEKSKIFTGVMYNTYSPPPGFCFDILCLDEPIVDNPYSYEYNVDKKVCKQLYALTDLGPEDWVDLNALRGYGSYATSRRNHCKLVSINPTQQNPQLDVPELNFQSCLLANISECKITEESDKFVVTVYNPLSRNVTHYVRLPVTGTAYKVLDYNGNPIVTQLMPISNTVLNIPGRMSASTVELIFVAKDVPPLGFLSFYVSKTTGNDVMEPKRLHSLSYQSQIGIDPDTGKVNKIKINDQLIPMEQDFYYYRGAVGNNSASEFRSSGAYIFRPNQSTPIQISETAHYELFEGSIVGELRQVFTNWTSQIVRVYKDEEFIEFDWLVGPIPVQDITGKEVITVYNTNLKTDSTFYTDSNGREMLKRVRDYRPTWKLEVNEKVAGNYYPVTSKIVMQDTDKNLEFAVLTDRAQGGTSLEDGEIELMLHRSCLHDDAFGVGENLRELAFGKALVARGSHYLIAGSLNGTAGGKTVAAQERDIAQRKLMAAWTFITETSASDFNAYKTQYNMRYAGLLRSLPDNVQILTLEPWKADTFLLRLEHVLEKSEDPILSQPVTVDLKNLFSTFDIIWYNETTLGANEWLSDNEKNKEKYDKILLTKTEKEDLEWQPNVLNDNEIDSNDIYDVFQRIEDRM